MKTGRNRKKFEVDNLFIKVDLKMKVLNKGSATFLLCPGQSFATNFALFEVSLSVLLLFLLCFFICFLVLSLLLGY